MVCEPASTAKQKRRSISWSAFSTLLAEHLQGLIRRFESNHVLGTDLATSLLAPACALFAQHEIRLPDGSPLTVRELLARLPGLVHTLELTGVLTSSALQSDVALKSLVQKAVDTGSATDVDRITAQWIRDAKERPSRATRPTRGPRGATGGNLHAGASYAMDLLGGRAGQADALWTSLPPRSQDALQAFFRALSLIGPEAGTTRQLADVALGRISLSSRASF